MDPRGRAHVSHSARNLLQRRCHVTVTVCEGRRRTGWETFRAMAELSRGLLHLGVERGERVAILALNSEWYLDWLVAVPMAGAIIAPLNYRWSPEEMREAISKINASTLVFDSTFSSLWKFFQSSCPSIRLGITIHPVLESDDIPSRDLKLVSMQQVLAFGRLNTSYVTPLDFRFSPDGICFICFTSGTTGNPKGVALSHEALISQSMAKIISVGYNQNDVYFHAAPLCHIGGASSAFAVLMACGTHIFLPKFQTADVIESLNNEKVSSFIAVPAMIVDMIQFLEKKEKTTHNVGNVSNYELAHREIGRVNSKTKRGMNLEESKDLYRIKGGIKNRFRENLYQGGNNGIEVNKLGEEEADEGKRGSKNGVSRFPFVKKVLIGGGALDETSFQKLCQIFPFARIITAYGMTEACSSITFNIIRCAPSEDPSLLQNLEPFCVGHPAPHVEIMISKSPDVYNTDAQNPSVQSDIVEADVGEEGEILTRGLHVMSGYWGERDATSAVLTINGWLRTGDVGYLGKNGYLFLKGRIKEMIKTGGENVHSTEVENVLRTHPSVLEACVVGLPHHRLGEEVCCLLVLKEGWSWQGRQQTTHLQLGDGLQTIKFEDVLHKEVNAQILKLHCIQSGLSRYKIPKLILVHGSSLPKTSSGKVKKELVKKIVSNMVSKANEEHGAKGSHGIKLSRL